MIYRLTLSTYVNTLCLNKAQALRNRPGRTDTQTNALDIYMYRSVRNADMGRVSKIRKILWTSLMNTAVIECGITRCTSNTITSWRKSSGPVRSRRLRKASLKWTNIPKETLPSSMTPARFELGIFQILYTSVNKFFIADPIPVLPELQLHRDRKAICLAANCSCRATEQPTV